MSRFVVDASVAAKWASPEMIEPLADRANQFLRDYLTGSVEIVVPDLFWLEIGNYFWKAARRGTLTPALAERGLEAMLKCDFPTLPSRAVLRDALKIAVECGRTVYDSTYVALAVATDGQLLTADERLVNALGTRFPVRWLGAL